MPINITRNFFKRTQEYLAKLIFNLLIVVFATSAFFFVIISSYIYLYGDVFLIPARWIYLLPGIAMMNTINQFNLTVFRNQQKAFSYGIYEISNTWLNFSITLVLVVIYLKGWEGRVGGILASTFFFGVIGLIRLRKDNFIALNADKEIIKEILLISLPLVPHAIGGAVIKLSDRLFIDRMVGDDAVGIYSVGYQFGMVMSLISVAFARSWSPWFHQKLASPTQEKKLQIVKATYGYAFVVILIAFGITLASYVLIPLMTTRPFFGASIYVGWVAFGYAFQGMYTLVFPYSVLVGNTSFIGTITFSVAGANLIGNYWLIKLNGTVGAAQSTMLSYFLMLISVWWYSNRLYPMPWFRFFSKA